MRLKHPNKPNNRTSAGECRGPIKIVPVTLNRKILNLEVTAACV